ncbi:cytochrome P450 [Bacillus sp. 165]|uniref:cytochrome P450 n=1 Tax=Bacillus sp. 165 TaxID=1529117 RepID=UPI001AD9B54F|nr:cytochrome P450 [Bacillus sp. 165]MBO9129113.1 cytochrome P450 [Bacillus sp. 165]
MEQQRQSYGLFVRPQGLNDAHSPYDWYKKMRKDSPVAFDPVRNCWDVFLHEDVQMVLQDYKRFSSNRNGVIPSLLDLDPPTHRRYRNIVSQAFTPKAIQALAPRITSVTHELLAAIQGKGEIDIVKDIAYPLPVIVIAEMLGVPGKDRAKFKEWSNVLVSGTQSLAPEEMTKLLEEQRKATLELYSYFQEIVSQRKLEPKNDLVSTLLAAEVDGEKLNMEELLSFCLVLLVAGNETTTNLVTNTMLTLFEHPDALEELYENPALIPSAIEEALRYRSPVHAMNRFVTEDIELKGMHLKKGQEVMAWIGSANRDEAVFERPNVFNIHRTSNNHISFGSGAHFCLGSQLARLEAKICITEMLKAFPNMELDTQKELQLVPSAFVYGYKALPVIVGLGEKVK